LDPIIAFYPKHVLYEVFGPPGTVASINYLDADAQPHEVVNAATATTMTITIGIQKRLATPNIYLPDSIASTSRRVRTNPTGE
ncbi:MmpS family transport accessory protein, partial [Mycobacterium tuberculosis]|uniref:MmpS family transport accessory protein n=1 Tax=Mycobacterium tuberculosis TaxID=1773 RepID=UPI003F804CF2